ncbi:glycosyltransferase 87 family protein [Streptomyces sp. TRM68367]|uniref:glycosyltransferase 87 family protein n=1 Tax=Streptomyces sp. TRM68367 TaxID=2758415 RepID=UPI00165C22C3|nr:glycosyltransferase 87 family protein [Streptomyces sp. TRM68367]MBC9728834.1 DUF2029 domain-containing protein [Streptomyces sp. TRM68367]
MSHQPLVAAPRVMARRPRFDGATPIAGPRRPVRRRDAGVRWDGVYWLACAGFALVLAGVTTQTTHRVWGVCASVGYAGAAVSAWPAPRRWGRTGALVAVTGAVVVPLVALLAAGQAQAEVHVVEHSAGLLLSTGSPYAPHPVDVDDFNPYLPGMALLGLPHALLGDSPLGDARFWFAVVFFASLALAARRLVPGQSSLTVDTEPRPSALLLVAAFPAVALPLAVGGIDLPVIGLMCLGLALAGRRGPGTAAGLAMGAAAALKWTAWPLLPVGLVLIAATSGRRAALRAAGTALAVAAVAVAPSALVDPHAFVEHVVLFPLGAGGIGSPATSPLPGYLLAHHVPGGRTLAVAALATSAVAMAVSLVVRPPRTVVAAADRLALGLGLAMCLMPATRFGYFVYPLVLLAWFRRGRLPAPAAKPADAARVKEVERIGALVGAGEGARA